jgi:hypothetical protein
MQELKHSLAYAAMHGGQGCIWRPCGANVCTRCVAVAWNFSVIAVDNQGKQPKRKHDSVQ